MQKMMFNKPYGLEAAVLELLKDMTRRMVPEKLLLDAMEYGGGDIEKRNRYLIEHAPIKVGEVVAVAQNYKDAGVAANEVVAHIYEGQNMYTLISAIESKGWNNKMFVSADLMPNRIRITDIKIEYLQDISEEDCMREGIRFYNCGIDFGFTAKGLRKRYGNAKEAFAVLIDKVSGKGTWKSNPLVYAYTFKLQKTDEQ